ncbi:HSF-type DNA-binding-domain-containing protein [Thelephora terrestris]|uniref:HSF-type DNA-binding-domain-containing protein n=1 Tax=Thelephora terrestris TaxID=56493 RepID=A0A9P6L6L7_9AGAM|nr:HSF-type DNA-binding-domain-containing protein [Thelephora terrestris]
MDFQSTTEIHYSHHPQQTQQHPHQQQPPPPQQQSWNQSAASLNSLLQPPQPSSLAPAQDHHHHQQQQLYHHYSTSGSADSRPQTSTSLSLNISGLSVASPTNLSPITPSTHQSTNSAVSPITPISPGQQGLGGGPGTHLHHHHHPAVHPFQFVPPPLDHRYDDQPTVSIPYDYSRRLNSSRSSSSDEKSIPRKRSFTTNASMLEDNIYETADVDIHTPNGSIYDEMDLSYTTAVSGSPADGGSNSGGEEDSLKPMSQSGSLGGKPITTNNFVTKLYQMIIDPKSAQFISWTELGTSFVVSNVAEFSRTILGSHFKHNNFSSFVRQLNMYGFHKINRTPRSQRSSSDVQTWEFSHHKFLRGRPDLLEEIKRKTMDPDPSLTSLKQRLELPGEIVLQLTAMKDENRRIRKELELERRKVNRLATAVKTMWDVVGRTLPGGLPASFPMDLLENHEVHGGPNILVTAPGSSNSPVTNGAHPTHLPALSLPNVNNAHGYSLSPGSSPTTSEFPVHQNSPHNLSRQSSFNFDGRYDHASLPPSPRPGQPGQAGDDRVKRQRMSPVDPPPMGTLSTIAGGNPNANGDDLGKKLPRARSDSAPMGGAGPGFFGHGNSNGGLGGYSYNTPGVPTRARGLSSAGGRGKNNTGF